MILFDTDHINILQFPPIPSRTLSINMSISMDQDFATSAVTLEEQLRGWLALIHDATLISANIRDFEKVPNLRVENWLV